VRQPPSPERQVDEPLPPDTWRPPMFRGRCCICGRKDIPEDEMYCAFHADLQEERDT